MQKFYVNITLVNQLQYVKMDNESHPIWIIIKKQLYNKTIHKSIHEMWVNLYVVPKWANLNCNVLGDILGT